MEVGSSQQAYTILRIKRKRTEEPLDALVFQSTKRKKSRAALDVFHFAQTVEDEVWKDDKRKSEIHEHVERLARTPSKNPPSPKPQIPLKRSRQDSPKRQYTIKPPSPGPSARSQSQTRSTSQREYRLLDVIRSDKTDGVTEEDSRMLEIQQLLNDYLKMEQPSVLPASTPITPEDDDYVWDVFYRHPGAITAPTGSIGTLSNVPGLYFDDSDSESEYGDEADEDSNAEDNYKNDYPDEESDEWSDGEISSAISSDYEDYRSDSD